RLVDRAAAPDPARAVEVEEAPRAAARGLLDLEMAVEDDPLELREEREVAVEVRPARLDEADLRVREVVHGLPEHVRERGEVGVEDRDELALRGLEAVREGARLEALAALAADELDVGAARAPLGDLAARDLERLVDRVVEDLHLEAVARVVEGADGVDQALD